MKGCLRLRLYPQSELGNASVESVWPYYRLFFMNKTKRIVIISVLCSLSVVLDIIKEFIPFINLPSGGSINISLIPIMVCSFTIGLKEGMICSILSFL